MTAFSTASAPELKSAEVLANVPGRERGELLADLDVTLVGRDHEAGVGEGGHLGADGVDELGHGVADRGDRDARAQVEQLVAVDVDEDRALGALDVNGESEVRPALTTAWRRSCRARDFGPGSSVTTLRSVPTDVSTDETMALS